MQQRTDRAKPELIGDEVPLAGGDLATAFARHCVIRQLLTPVDAERALEARRRTGQRIDLVLTELGLVSEAALMPAMAEFFRMPLVPPSQLPRELDLLGLEPDFLRRNLVLPLGQNGANLVVATSNPFTTDVLDSVAYYVDRPVEARLMHPRELAAAIDGFVGGQEVDEPNDLTQGTVLGDHDVERLKDAASEAPIVRLVSRLLTEAVQRGASDIHIEARSTQLVVRYRIDGVLADAEVLPIDVQAGVATRLKILARLNIAERRMPQDGRIKVTVAGREVDVRISSVPTQHGESVVMRLLDKERVELSFDTLGLDGPARSAIERLIGEPNGIVLVTGPTGSGKTTTLYAALKLLNKPETKVFSVEDPVEYQLPGVNQMQVKREIGLDFVHALRAILRQDPDVIMVGEIRDVETARIAIQASLTGHLVLSTLHTNSAAAAITRLIDMGVEDYLLASSLAGVMAQRLVRRLCPACARSKPLDPPLARRLAEEVTAAGRKIDFAQAKAAVGCPSCRGTGYSGRTAITEALIISDELRGHIVQRSSDREIERIGRSAGMETLLESGLRKVAAGLTTVEEVLRVARL